MLNVVLIDPLSKTPLHAETIYTPTVAVRGDEVLPVYMTGAQAHGTFTSATRTSAGTTILTSPNLTGSLILTDMVLGTDKVNASTVSVNVTDGVRTEKVFSTNLTDAPANVAIAFVGRWQGWQDARVELVTTGNVTATVSIGYIKVPQGSPYAQWNSLR